MSVPCEYSSTCFPTIPVKRGKRARRGEAEKKGGVIHTDTDTLMMLSGSRRGFEHTPGCVCGRVRAHGRTHRRIRQALHHCQVANLEGEAASCRCNKSQKALLCLSVPESFILTAARTNNVRLNGVLFILRRIKEDKQTVMFSSVSLRHIFFSFLHIYMGVMRCKIKLQIAAVRIKRDYPACFII